LRDKLGVTCSYMNCSSWMSFCSAWAERHHGP
jgi:hypothetical protein